MKKLDQAGFALPLVLALLPILLAALIVAFATAGFIQNDLKIKYQCRAGGLRGQSRVAPFLKTILGLNPLAHSLRLQKIKALQEIATATAAKNPLALAAATHRYQSIRKKQELLHSQQIQFIKQANLVMQQAHLTTALQLKSTGQSLTNIFLKQDVRFTRNPSPKLALHPDDSDIAPTYSLNSDFENDQALVHQWQYVTTVRAPYSLFMPGSFHFDKVCSVTLRKDNSQWLPTINAGKYSLRSVW